MSPQFVDLNADGHIDIVAGTFDGSPHVSYGSAAGFAKPGHILDKEGKRIISSFYWDYGKRKWTTVGKAGRSQITSAYVYDWDADGDLDLLLGDYAGGRVYLRLNEGSAKEPKFATTSTQVQVAGKPLVVADKLATVRMVDWDRDGKLDLVAGSMGSTYGKKTAGVVRWYRNTGEPGKPVFAAGKVLVRGKTPEAGADNGPHAFFYFDLTDVDGDGDLDMYVGGKSIVLPKARELSAEEQAEATRLKSKLDEVNRKLGALYSAALKAAGDRKAKDWRAKYKAAIAKSGAEMKTLRTQSSELRAKHVKLVPVQQVLNRVWLYRNTTAALSGSR